MEEDAAMFDDDGGWFVLSFLPPLLFLSVAWFFSMLFMALLRILFSVLRGGEREVFLVAVLSSCCLSIASFPPTIVCPSVIVPGRAPPSDDDSLNATLVLPTEVSLFAEGVASDDLFAFAAFGVVGLLLVVAVLLLLLLLSGAFGDPSRRSEGFMLKRRS